MILHSDVAPVGNELNPGELVLFMRNGAQVLAIAAAPNERGQFLVILRSDREEVSFRRKLINPEAHWATFGTEWLLELVRGNEVGNRDPNLVLTPGVVSRSQAGAFLALGDDGYPALNLTDFSIAESKEYDALPFPKWRIWRSEGHRKEPGAEPIFQTG